MEMIQIDLRALRCPLLLLQVKAALRTYPDARYMQFHLAGSAELTDITRVVQAAGWRVSHYHESQAVVVEIERA
ncbi:MAG: sulfurtransferase TusA family protein [Plesiomonas sp.]|uniref:sulfurtransferase TusA family protein n=1 Tax=Plesiomonas sp. TaxID=2486279 RepID=UPI003F3C329B